MRQRRVTAILIILLATTILALSVVASSIYIGKQSAKSQSSYYPVPRPPFATATVPKLAPVDRVPPTRLPTGPTKTYRNEQYGFSFQYSSTATIETVEPVGRPPASLGGIFVVGPDQDIYWYHKLPGKSLLEWYKEQFKDEAVATSTVVDIHGYQGLDLWDGGNPELTEELLVANPEGNLVVEFVFAPVDHTIIDSFRFN